MDQGGKRSKRQTCSGVRLRSVGLLISQLARLNAVQITDYAAPDGAGHFLRPNFYKDVAPNGATAVYSHEPAVEVGGSSQTESLHK